MNNQAMPEGDARVYARNIAKMIEGLIVELRGDMEEIDDLQAKALFEVSAEVLGGLQKAFNDYENRSEEAWK